jgi:hypothetical protein
VATTARFTKIVLVAPITGTNNGDGSISFTVPLDGATIEFASSVLRVKDLGVTEAKLGLSDVTTANATTGRHGLLPKLDGNSAHFLTGTGAWATPVPDPSLQTTVWMPLTTVVGGVPDLVWSGTDNLIPTLGPL